MPHLTVEYSANLDATGAIDALCRELAEAIDRQFEDGRKVFPTGGIRVRALRCEHYCIADGRLDAAFVHANFRVGRGRSEAARRAAGAALLAALSGHFAGARARQGLALSVEVNEFNELGTWKQNDLHALLKSRQEQP
jgi:5-carboxymethyl-2-hydroxymuconate isomerase